MSEINTLDKFSCVACGAKAVWNAAKQELRCPYCGTTSDLAEDNRESEVVEHDLLSALENLAEDQQGWDKQVQTIRCTSCNAVSVLGPEIHAQRCDFCGSPAIIDEKNISRPIRPMAILPLTVPESKVREQIHQWYGSHFWAPNNLKNRALTDTVHGVYIPYWTFDAQVYTEWTGEAGFDESSTDSDGNTTTTTRWEYRSGELKHFFDDKLVPASRGVHPKLIYEVEPFPTTTDLRPYDPKYLSGWVVEQYQINLPEAARISQERMEAKLIEMIAASMNADRTRNIKIDPQYSNQTFKHVLLPVWVLCYNYGRKSFQVIVNGSTGKIAGEYPISWVKVTLAILITLIIVLLLSLIEETPA